MPLTPMRQAMMRTLADRYLGDLCRISRPGAPVSDNAGGSTVTATEGSAIPCSVRSRDVFGEEGVGGLQIKTDAAWLIRFKAGVDIKPTDRIVVEGATERTFLVVAVAAPRTRELHRVANCRLTS